MDGDFAGVTIGPAKTRVEPSPVTPDSIAALCRTAQALIDTQAILPDFREAMEARFESHEGVTRAHMLAIHDHGVQLKELAGLIRDLNLTYRDQIAATKQLSSCVEELTNAIEQQNRG